MTPSQPGLASRDAPLDALRVAALVGVFVVNWVGYLSGPFFPSPLGPPVPLESAATVGLMWGLMTLLQGKAYPLMAFALGYGLQSAWLREARRTDAANATRLRRWRDARMALLGLAHGYLIYAGDILLAYALVAWVVVRYAAQSSHILRRKWRKWLIVWLVVDALVLALFLSPLPLDLGARETYLATATNWRAWWSLNAAAYSATLSWALWFLMPQLLCFAVAGMWAARWRLCSAQEVWRSSAGQHAVFAQRFWRRCMPLPWLVGLLGLNAALAWIWLHDPDGKTTAGQWAAPLWYPSSGALAVAYLSAFMRWARSARASAHVHRWALAARLSLTAYLSLSVLLVVSLHFGMLPGEATWARFGLAAVLYVLFMHLARWVSAALDRLGRSAPLEGWVSGASKRSP